MPGCDIFRVLLALLFLSWLAMEMSERKIFLQCERNFVEKGMKLQYMGCWHLVGMQSAFWGHHMCHKLTSSVTFLAFYHLLLLVYCWDRFSYIWWVLSDSLVKNIDNTNILKKKIKKSHLKEKQTPKYESFIWISAFWFFLSHTSSWCFWPLLFGCISSKYFWVFGNPGHCKVWAGIVKVWLESLSRAWTTLTVN